LSFLSFSFIVISRHGHSPFTCCLLLYEQRLRCFAAQHEEASFTHDEDGIAAFERWHAQHPGRLPCLANLPDERFETLDLPPLRSRSPLRRRDEQDMLRQKSAVFFPDTPYRLCLVSSPVIGQSRRAAWLALPDTPPLSLWMPVFRQLDALSGLYSPAQLTPTLTSALTGRTTPLLFMSLHPGGVRASLCAEGLPRFSRLFSLPSLPTEALLGTLRREIHALSGWLQGELDPPVSTPKMLYLLPPHLAERGRILLSADDVQCLTLPEASARLGLADPASDADRLLLGCLHLALPKQQFAPAEDVATQPGPAQRLFRWASATVAALGLAATLDGLRPAHETPPLPLASAPATRQAAPLLPPPDAGQLHQETFAAHQLPWQTLAHFSTLLEAHPEISLLSLRWQLAHAEEEAAALPLRLFIEGQSQSEAGLLAFLQHLEEVGWWMAEAPLAGYTAGDPAPRFTLFLSRRGA
jgi:hypothetical protein